MSDRDDDVTRPDPEADATRREGPGARPRASGGRSDTEVDVPALEKGAKIGRYVVIDLLGAGGMGVVYSAFDPELDRKVAIKLLQASVGGSESGGQSWLIREAQAMARLAHPNVVAVHDVGAMSHDQVFVAMELVDGVTLRKWLDGGKRTWREIVKAMSEAGAGLAAAHAAGLVHRDFKPDNVIVGKDGRVRVMDFGLARLHGDASRESPLPESKSPLSERLTATGALLGTPAYMAPETYAGQAVDARADQFAFGVALYEALFRVRPFERAALVEKRATVPRVPAKTNVPEWVTRIVLRAIAIDPAQRYPSMDALLADLARDPTPKPKWRLIVRGVAALTLLGVPVAGMFALRSNHTAAPEPCRDSPAALERAWNPPARAALEKAFRAVNKPFVDDAIRGTEKSLDAYGAGWVAMRTEACQATRVHGNQSEAVLTVRMQCLDERLVEMQTLAQLFSHADEQLALAGAAATQKLSAIADCADVAALLAPDPLPKEPAARSAVLALQAKLAEARATYKAARPKDALAITEAIAADVKRAQHHPTEAVWHFLTGQARWVLQGADQGEPELMQAVLAAEAGKADEIKVEAWLQLTNLATETSRFDVAAERLLQANAALSRLGTKWDLQVRVLASEALLASRQSNLAKALDVAKQARLLAEQHTEMPTRIYATLVEATILNAGAQPEPALDDLRKVLAYHESFGHHRIEVAATLSTMASAEFLVGKIDEAAAHFRDVLAIDEAIYGPESTEGARALSGLAVAQSAKGDSRGAVATNQRALDMVKRLTGDDNDQYAMILGQLAGNLIDLGKHAEALPYLDRALAIQNAKLGPANVQTLTLMLTKCDALGAAGSHRAAIETCKSALATAEQAFGKTNAILFLFVAHTGMALLDDNQGREASAMFERAIALGATDPSDIAFVTMLDARAHWAMKDHRRAIELARKARDAFATFGEAKADQTREADAWLKEHRR